MTDTKFTDDDLKLWKEKKEYGYEKLQALLARLEAAEKVVECAVDCYQMESKVVEAWRKSKGEL